MVEKTDELLKLKLSGAEHDCWQKVCAKLKNLGIDINNTPDLNAALVKWGERLAQLRELTGQVYTNVNQD